jgi:outer membrane protein TolC
MKYYFIPVLFVCVIFAGFASAEPLTLENAVNIAVGNNRELKASRYNSESADYAATASKGKYLPQIDIEGKYTKLNGPIEIDLSDIKSAMITADVATLRTSGVTNPSVLQGFAASLNSALPAFTDRIQNDSFYNLSATLVQPIFAGGKIYANAKVKSLESSIAQEQEITVKNKIIAETVTNYYRIKLMDSVVNIRKEVMDGIAEHNSDAEKMYAQGLISNSAQMRAKVALSEAQREYYKALRDRELAVMLFDNTLARPTSGYTFTTDIQLPSNARPAEYYTRAALELNPNLLILNRKISMLKQKMNAIRGNFLPTIAAFGRYELYKEDLTFLDPEWAAGVTAKINIFGGGSDVFDLMSSKKEIRMLEEYTVYAEEMVKTEVKKYIHDMETSKEQHESLNRSKELAEENLKLARLSFKEGLATSTDVIDAELSLGNVKTEQLKALLDYNTALVYLLSSCGNAMDIFTYGR